MAARCDRSIEEAWRSEGGPGLDLGRGATLAFIRRLRNRGIVTVPDLIGAFPDLHRRTQRAAVRLFGDVGDRRAVPVLTKLFHEARFCPHTDLALSQLGGSRAISYMMGVIEEEMRRPLRQRDEGRLFCALDALSTMEDNEVALELLLDLARRSDASVDVRALAVEAMGLMAEEVGASMPGARRVRVAVLAALEDASPAVRMSGIDAVEWMGLVAARPHLRRMAQADQSHVRGVGRISVRARSVLAELPPARGSAAGRSASD